jgi:hypothetical protein
MSVGIHTFASRSEVQLPEMHRDITLTLIVHGHWRRCLLGPIPMHSRCVLSIWFKTTRTRGPSTWWSIVQPIFLVDGAICRLHRWYDLSTWSMLRPIDLVDGTTTHRLRRWYDLMVGPIHLADCPPYGLGRLYDLSTWWMVRLIDLVDATTYHSDDGATYPLRPWFNLWTWPMVPPINLDDGTTHRLRHGTTHAFGRWHLLSTRTMIRPRSYLVHGTVMGDDEQSVLL